MPARSHRPATNPLVLVLLTAVVVTVTLAAPATGSALAQPAEPPAITGSWTLGFPNDDPTSRHLASFLPGGVVLMTNAPVFAEAAVAGDQIYSTAGHGAWIRLDDGRYAFTVVFLYFDAAEENWGTLTVHGLVMLDSSGDSFTGTFTATATDAAGGPLFAGEDEPLTGARIRPRIDDQMPVQ